MDLENVIKGYKRSKGKFVKAGVGVLTSLVLLFNGCDILGPKKPDDPTKVEVSGGLTVDPAHTGMIKGRVLSSEIQGNIVVFKGLEKAYVYLKNTDFKTDTLSEGVYSFDNVPAGSYSVVAWENWNAYEKAKHPEDVKPVTVEKQTTVTVPDLKLVMEPILHGKVYESDKTTPFANKKITLYGKGLPSDPWEGVHSITTSSDGSYLFKRTKARGGFTEIFEIFKIRSDYWAAYFIDTDDYEVFIPFRYDIVEKNAYISLKD